jgi:hypothetical protein
MRTIDTHDGRLNNAILRPMAILSEIFKPRGVLVEDLLTTTFIQTEHTIIHKLPIEYKMQLIKSVFLLVAFFSSAMAAPVEDTTAAAEGEYLSSRSNTFSISN